jgi:hypothetical protein
MICRLFERQDSGEFDCVENRTYMFCWLTSRCSIKFYLSNAKAICYRNSNYIFKNFSESIKFSRIFAFMLDINHQK